MTKSFDERNLAKSRAAIDAMDAAAGTRALTQRERKILDMWPRFEDGEPVMPGDQAMDGHGSERTINYITVTGDGNHIAEDMLLDMACRFDERVKRPEPEVLDADGVPIRKGDTVWTLDGLEGVVTKVEDGAAYIAYESDYAQLEEAVNLTHAQPVYETRESVVYEIGEDMAKRIDAIVSAGRWK